MHDKYVLRYMPQNNKLNEFDTYYHVAQDRLRKCYSINTKLPFFELKLISVELAKTAVNSKKNL